jgi:hypothetical protein
MSVLSSWPLDFNRATIRPIPASIVSTIAA